MRVCMGLLEFVQTIIFYQDCCKFYLTVTCKLHHFCNFSGTRLHTPLILQFWGRCFSGPAVPVGPVFYCSDVLATVQIAVQLVTQLVDVGLFVGLFVGLVGEAGNQQGIPFRPHTLIQRLLSVSFLYLFCTVPSG